MIKVTLLHEEILRFFAIFAILLLFIIKYRFIILPYFWPFKTDLDVCFDKNFSKRFFLPFLNIFQNRDFTDTITENPDFAKKFLSNFLKSKIENLAVF